MRACADIDHQGTPLSTAVNERGQPWCRNSDSQSPDCSSPPRMRQHRKSGPASSMRVSRPGFCHGPGAVQFLTRSEFCHGMEPLTARGYSPRKGAWAASGGKSYRFQRSTRSEVAMAGSACSSCGCSLWAGPNVPGPLGHSQSPRRFCPMGRAHWMPNGPGLF